MHIRNLDILFWHCRMVLGSSSSHRTKRKDQLHSTILGQTQPIPPSWLPMLRRRRENSPASIAGSEVADPTQPSFPNFGRQQVHHVGALTNLARTPPAIENDFTEEELQELELLSEEARDWAFLQRLCLISPIVAIFVIAVVSATINWKRIESLKKGQSWIKSQCLIVDKRIGNSTESTVLALASNLSFRGEVIVRDYGLTPAMTVPAYLSSSNSYIFTLSYVNETLFQLKIGKMISQKCYVNFSFLFVCI
jgi:hypothetical protein